MGWSRQSEKGNHFSVGLSFAPARSTYQLGHLLHSKSAELPKTAGLEEVVVLDVEEKSDSSSVYQNDGRLSV